MSVVTVVVVALMVLSVARDLRAGNYRAAAATLVMSAIAKVYGPVALFCLPVHIYIHRPERPRVVDFGRTPRLG